jgi:hypothetical protein
MKKILLSAFLFFNYLQAETAKDIILDYQAPSLWKYTIASKYKPESKMVSINEAIRLYKQIIAKNEDSELVRASYYGIADLYFQIYYSKIGNSSFLKYKALGDEAIKMAMYLAADKIHFNVFKINGVATYQDLPPKFILTEYLYLAPIKMLFYLYLSGQSKHYDFVETDMLLANQFLNDLLRLNYIPAYKYKLKNILNDIKSNFKIQDKKFIINVMDSIEIYNEGIKILQTSNDLNRVKHYTEIKDIINQININFTNKINIIIEKTEYEPYMRIGNKWNELFEKRETTIYKIDKKVIADFKKKNNARIKLSKEKYAEKEKLRNEKFEIRRKQILKETGRDIMKEDAYGKMIKQMFNQK